MLCNVELVECNHEFLEGTGSFCLRSKKKSSGYLNKNKWLNNSFEEGLKYVQVMDNKNKLGLLNIQKQKIPQEWFMRMVI
ncbi:hypothetical protein [Lysinibacillus xylanilyticus]|uniref:hypothetical protein n=1 Tax=Lysinibacillus xylanilyticus TaxID=582475 RepID=UPI003AF279A2